MENVTKGGVWSVLMWVPFTSKSVVEASRKENFSERTTHFWHATGEELIETIGVLHELANLFQLVSGSALFILYLLYLRSEVVIVME